jgi:hypothetical protein
LGLKLVFQEQASFLRKSMPDIQVTKIDNVNFQVTVSGQTTTTHHVTLQDAYANKLTNNQFSKEVLVKKSFEFLLEREPNTSILRHFDLTVISRYFPEYEVTISK